MRPKSKRHIFSRELARGLGTHTERMLARTRTLAAQSGFRDEYQRESARARALVHSYGLIMFYEHPVC